MAMADHDRIALLVMDLQPEIVDPLDAPDYLERVGRALSAARAAGVAPVFVRAAFRPGHPEVSADNRIFAWVKDSGMLVDGEPGSDIHPAVAPHPGELVVTKRRISAFAGSDLDCILRARRVEHLVLAGYATSGVVLSTLRYAADLDYRLTVLADCCIDTDPDAHRVLLENVFPSQADVADMEAWAASLSRSA